MATDKVLVLGGGGRVGLQITAELLRAGIDVCLVDILPHEVLQQRAGRTLNDSRLAVAGPVRVANSLRNPYDAARQQGNRYIINKIFGMIRPEENLIHGRDQTSDLILAPDDLTTATTDDPG